ncbi:MAG: GLPGLI family protein [Bacteroides sp.]|nr:GLPGLI family protein [Bacteroides sp.]
MKHLFIFILSAFGLACSLHAKVIEEYVLEPAILEVEYERVRVTDTLLVETDFKTDYLTLMAGKTISAFYSASLKTNDSLCIRSVDYLTALMEDRASFGAVSALEREVVYRNHPAGKITIHDQFSLCNWVYVEDWVKPEWEVTDSTTNIGGYECLLAISHYRGRVWYAWFTPEIPISEGPWKLCGLPGLILEAFDEKRHYHYTATTIKLNPGRSVEFFNYRDRLKTNRRAALKEKRRFLQENLKNLLLSSGALSSSDPDKMKLEIVDKSKPLPHKNYDFEETDYPHE